VRAEAPYLDQPLPVQIYDKIYDSFVYTIVLKLEIYDSFIYVSTLGLRVIKKEERKGGDLTWRVASCDASYIFTWLQVRV